MMKHLVVIALALAGFMAMTHTAFAHPSLRHTYLHLHSQLGDTAGRNIVKHGARVHGEVRSPSDHMIARSIRTMRSMLAPPVFSSPVAPVNAVMASVTVPAGPAGPVGSMPDCTWKPESGGSYTASNPSGAYGKYQIMPVHYGAGGVCAGMGKSPSEQEVCARRVFASSGAGAWVNC